jgi:hypothetical protein
MSDNKPVARWNYSAPDGVSVDWRKPMPAFSLVVAVSFACLVIGHESKAADLTTAKAAEEGVWSEAVNGLQARVELRRVQVMNGTTVLATYLHLRNASDVFNPLSIPWNSKLMSFRVVDEKGKDLAKYRGPFDGHVLAGTADLILPIRGQLSFDYSCHGAGIPGDKGAHLDLGVDDTWQIERNQDHCVLLAVLEVPKSKREDGEVRHWHGRIELPPVKIPVGTELLDARAKARINELGPRLLDKDSRVAEEAERALSLIDDPAVIPWYIRALDSNRYHMKFRAIDQLGRFDSDEAFDALKKSLTTQPSDFGDTASPSVAPDLVHNIRVAAVQRLSRCPHRDAKKYVLSLWNDPDPSVRIDVLHLLGKMGTPEALQLLKKMSTDGNELVRSEAARYLKLQSE